MADVPKLRMVQEYVPGKQITLAHIIVHPKETLAKKLGLTESHAIGIMTITPSEAAIIAADRALKAAAVEVEFVDRFTGSLVVSGQVTAVETALKEANGFLTEVLGFQGAKETRS